MRRPAAFLLATFLLAPGLAASAIGHPPTREKGPVPFQNPVEARTPLHRFTHDHGPGARARAFVLDPRQGQGRVDHPQTREKGSAA